MKTKSEILLGALALVGVFILSISICACDRKPDPAVSPGTTSAIAASCCADSINTFPSGLAEAIRFTLSSQCTMRVQAKMTASSLYTTKFTFTITPPPLAGGSALEHYVSAGATKDASFNFVGPGTYEIAASSSVDIPGGSWHMGTIIFPPPSGIVIGTLPDTSESISVEKGWKVTFPPGSPSVDAGSVKYELCLVPGGSMIP